MQHLIKKQRINITLSKQADAFRLQQLVNDHYKQDVLPLLEDVFDDLSDEDEVLQIEQLVIDLGILSGKEINAVRWDDSILSEIKKQLHEKIGQKGKNMSVKQEPIKFSVCKQWFFYMQKGYLPWNTLHINEAWYKKVLEALAVDFANVAELRRIIIENSVVSKRIIQQHDESFLITLAEILIAEDQGELSAAIDALLQLILSPNSGLTPGAGSRPEELKRKIWEQVFQQAVLEQGKQTTVQLTQKILKQRRKLYENQEKVSEDEPATSEEVDEDGVFVQHAGIVLVHPFLPSLFKRLHLIVEGKFADTLARQKALYLLHYIGKGTAAAQEYELTMPKVLCEWPLQMPVERNIVLNEDELNEADTMLQAAIEQWTVLKNTSIEGLREGFLQRAGKLFTKNDNLHLQVETSSIDILLDQLPWNLSMIKLPWTKKMLRVEWR